MNGCDPRLAVVNAINTRADGNGVEKAVLVTVHPSGAHNGSLGEGLSDSLLSLKLGAIELGCRVGGGVEVGEVNEAVDARELSNARKTTSTRDVYIVEVEVPVRGQASDGRADGA